MRSKIRVKGLFIVLCVCVLCSILGHKLGGLDGLIPYTASKHAVTVLTEGLRRELVQLGSKIRVTSISPGSVDTDMLRAALAEGVEPPPALHSEDIAGAVIYALGAPPHVQVHEITIKPVGEVHQ